jgi:hypothetical protein
MPLDHKLHYLGETMTYTLIFISKFGLWELRLNHFRARFYRDHYGAVKTVTRYRRMLQSEQDRYEKLVPESCGPFGDYYVPRSKISRSHELKAALSALEARR